jgi:hypothetical protein
MGVVFSIIVRVICSRLPIRLDQNALLDRGTSAQKSVEDEKCYSIAVRGFFQQSLLEFFLAFDAVAGPWHGFEALGVDFLTAVNALSKAALANARKCFLYHLQKLALVVALGEEKFFRVRTRGAIGDILSGVFIGGATVSLIAGNRAAQIFLPRFEPFFESF